MKQKFLKVFFTLLTVSCYGYYLATTIAGVSFLQAYKLFNIKAMTLSLVFASLSFVFTLAIQARLDSSSNKAHGDFKSSIALGFLVLGVATYIFVLPDYSWLSALLLSCEIIALSYLACSIIKREPSFVLSVSKMLVVIGLLELKCAIGLDIHYYLFCAFGVAFALAVFSAKFEERELIDNKLDYLKHEYGECNKIDSRKLGTVQLSNGCEECCKKTLSQGLVVGGDNSI